jgi:drug/metabolite transporter (DMT)-like permease
MKRIGDVGELRRRKGLAVLAMLVLRNKYFLLGVACMAISFYSLLFGLSWNDVSLIGPAAASLTFVANAIGAKIFLHEKVDRRRWAAALFVAAGVVLMGV